MSYRSRLGPENQVLSNEGDGTFGASANPLIPTDEGLTPHERVQAVICVEGGHWTSPEELAAIKAGTWGIPQEPQG